MALRRGCCQSQQPPPHTVCLLGAWLLATMWVPGSCHVDTACSPPCLCACSGNEFFPPPFLGLFPGRLGLWEGRRALARELFPSDTPPTPWAGVELGALIVPSPPPQATLRRCLPRSVCADLLGAWVWGCSHGQLHFQHPYIRMVGVSGNP